MSTRRNTNLNKELGNDWIGRVRKWEKKWVACEDKSAPQLPHGAKRPLQLLKWVQTEVRAKPQAAPRYPHIVPVKDLSLVPGARLGTPVDAAAAAGQVADPLAAPPIQIDLTPEKAPPTQTAAADTVAAIVGQQQQQQDGDVTAADAGLPPLAPSAAAAAGPGSSLVDPGVQGSQAAAAAAAAAVGPISSLGADGAILPSPSGTTGTVNFDLSYDYAQHPVSSLSRGAFDPFSIPPQPAAAAAAASDYTAGTDSEALGRLPHGGVTASDYTGGGDSMDIDLTQPTGEVDMEDDDEDDDDVVDGDEDHDEDEDDDDDDHRGVIGADDDEDDDDEEQDGLGDDDDEIEDDDDMPS